MLPSKNSPWLSNPWPWCSNPLKKKTRTSWNVAPTWTGFLANFQCTWDSFIEHCLNKSILKEGSRSTYALRDLAARLEVKAKAKSIAHQATISAIATGGRKEFKSQEGQKRPNPTTMCLNSEAGEEPGKKTPLKSKNKFQPYCPYCNSKGHFLGSCPRVKKLTQPQLKAWLTSGERRYKCARSIRRRRPAHFGNPAIAVRKSHRVAWCNSPSTEGS